MPTLTIDGREIEVTPGTRVIEAARQLGIEIPHYCYHPGLSIAGSCRLCLVEIEKFPKLAIACHTVATDGMVVHTTSDKARAARAAMMEFLLANHPLDCPVCDQAGECKLQQYYMEVAQHDSTLLDNKVKKTKAKVLGPHVILDSERCILCSRCVRFTAEISKTHELGIFNRGDHSELLTYPGRVLDNAYSACVNDICPVGALTDRDFRFKVRVWYLSAAPSICHGCARGCNIRVDFLTRRLHHNDGKRIARYRPRFNPDVNGYWMCDAGRYSYKTQESDNRLLNAQVNGSTDDKTDMDTALAKTAQALSDAIAEFGVDSVAVIASASISNEEMFATRTLFHAGLKIEQIAWRIPPGPEDKDDDILIRADKNANTFGAEQIFGPISRSPEVHEAMDQIVEGKIKALVILDRDLAPAFGEQKVADVFNGLQFACYIGSHLNPTSRQCGYLLPSAVYTEKEGSITNFEGTVQHFPPVVTPLGDSLPMLQILSELAKACRTDPISPGPADVYAVLAGEIDHFKDKTFTQLIEETAPMDPVGK